MEIVDFIRQNGDKVSLSVLMSALLIATRWFWTEYRKQHEDHKREMREITDGCETRLTGLTQQLFDVIDKNTEAFTRHTESVNRNTDVASQLKERLSQK
jgi:formiminotetrahydrofolate cyclodeaminase